MPVTSSSRAARPRRKQPVPEPAEESTFGEITDPNLKLLAAWITSGCEQSAWELLTARASESEVPAWLCPRELGLDSNLEHKLLCYCLAWAVLPSPGEKIAMGRSMDVRDVAQGLGLTAAKDICELHNRLQGTCPLDPYLHVSRQALNMSSSDFMGAELEIPLHALGRLLKPSTEKEDISKKASLADLCLPSEVRRQVEALLAAPPVPGKPFWLALTGSEGSGRRSLGICLADALGRELVHPPQHASPGTIMGLTRDTDGNWNSNPQRFLRSESWVFLYADNPEDPFVALSDLVLNLGVCDAEARKAFVTQEASKVGFETPLENLDAMLERYPLQPGHLRLAVELAGRKANGTVGAPKENARFLEQGLSAVAARPSTTSRRPYGREGTDPKEAIEKLKPKLRRPDLVLSPSLGESLDRFIRAVKSRGALVKDWGLDERVLPSNKGVFLFHGPSGTGKSMAAEVMAAELGTDLWRIQAASLQSPYVGETEQRVAGLFRALKGSPAVILLDEVDNFLTDRAKDISTTKAHNQGVVNAFLRELDTFEGILVFTTNLAAELDSAVERRIQTRLCFPLPGEAERRQIWKNLWKDTIPTDGTVDLAELARRYDFPGGLIRNTFLAACQRGAEVGRMSQEILRAACIEEQDNRLKHEASRRVKGFAA